MDSIFESALLSAWFLISEIVTPWPSRIEVPKEWMGNVGGLGDIDNGDLRGDSVGLNKLNVPPRKHGEAGLWMRRWARDPFPSDGRKISSASGASKLYRLMGEGVRGTSARTVAGAKIPGLCRAYRYRIAKSPHGCNALFLGWDHTDGIQSGNQRKYQYYTP